MHSPTRSLLFVPLVSIAIYACSDAEAPENPLKGYEDVLLEGDVTTETLVAFSEALAQRGVVDTEFQKAVFDWPADGEIRPKSPPTPFCWHIGPISKKNNASSSGAHWAGLGSSKFFDPIESEGFAAPLRELFGAPRQAFAAEKLYNGRGTFLVFSTKTNPKLLRIFTSAVVFHPSEAMWEEMAATGEPITATLTSATFQQGRIGPDDGPFSGSSITITIAP